MNEIDTLRATIAGLSLAVPHWVEDFADGAPTALVLLLDDLRSLRQELGTVEAYAEAQAARAMPKRNLPLPDGRVAEKSSYWARKDWQHRLLLLRVWAEALAISYGDLDDAAERFVTMVETRAGISYWRTRELRAAGLDPDDFSRRDKHRSTVRISPKPVGAPEPYVPDPGPDWDRDYKETAEGSGSDA